MYPIYSYGSPRFALANLSVSFPAHNSAGIISFLPVEEHHETLSGKTITIFKGYRAEIQLKLFNLKPQDYQLHLTLINIINQSRKAAKPILLQPRFSSGATLSLYVTPQDEIRYEDITNLNAGQSINLKFFTPDLLSALPLIVNTPRFLMINDSSYLILSSSKNKVIIPHTNYQEISTTTNESFY